MKLALSPHFDYYGDKIGYSSLTQATIEPTAVQLFMLKTLCSTLEQLFRIPSQTPIKINSGLRNYATYSALLRARYPASRTSDHFAGVEINGWRWGTGAFDFAFISSDNDAMLKEYYRKTLRDDSPRIGQLIYYEDTHIIHISNAREIVYGAELAKAIESDYITFKGPLSEKFLVHTAAGYKLAKNYF